MRPKHFLAALLLTCLYSPLAAEPTAPTLSVLPWNGAPAALSLTFDDGDPSHLDVAIPLLAQHGWKGTFFLIANKIERREEWRKAFEAGHELGNHSLDHLHAAELDAEQEKSQVVGSRNVLAKSFGVPVRVYAYPFVEISPGLKRLVSQTHLSGRGGFASPYFMKPGDEPDWANLPSRTTKSADTTQTHQAWLKETLDAKAWNILMIHGLEGTRWGWEPISKKIFGALLDEAAKGGFWVATQGEVTAYWKAQKILEASVSTVKDGVTRWSWSKPPDFPDQVILKVRVSAPKDDPSPGRFFAGKKALVPSAEGILSVPFAAQSLEYRPE